MTETRLNMRVFMETVAVLPCTLLHRQACVAGKINDSAGGLRECVCSWCMCAGCELIYTTLYFLQVLVYKAVQPPRGQHHHMVRTGVDDIGRTSTCGIITLQYCPAPIECSCGCHP